MKLDFNDRAMLVSMGLILAAALGYGWANDAMTAAVLIGGGFFAVAVGVAMASGGGSASVIAMPVLGMALVGLLIHTARGHAEAHFAVFAFLACTTVYRRWESVIAGAAAIAVHHLSFNYLQQWGWGPVCFTEPSLLKVVEHAAYVVAEAGVLVMLAVRAREDFRGADELGALVEGIVGQDGSISLEAAHRPAQAQTTKKLQELGCCRSC